MINPVVGEEVWLAALGGLPPLAVTAARVVLVSPHPDDETLGAGALLADLRGRGVPVTVAAVTDGENAYQQSDGLAETRRREQMEALHVLGVEAPHICRFGLTDSGVEQEKERLVELMTPLVDSDTHLIAPWTGDFHPDHEACGWAAKEVALRTGARLSWYFFWTWHRGTPADLKGLELSAFRFDDVLLETKLRALECHRSQLYRENAEPILPVDLLGPARRKFEVFAHA